MCLLLKKVFYSVSTSKLFSYAKSAYFEQCKCVKVTIAKFLVENPSMNSMFLLILL